MTPLRLLVAEDNDDDYVLIQQAIRRHGLEFEARRITRANELRDALATADWDIILCDYSMPGFNALEALEIIRATGLDIPVIIVSGTIGEEVAIETLKQGANDYILKQNLTRLGPAMEHELRDASDRRQRRLVEAFSTGQGEVLELILEKRPLPEILAHIARRIESLPLSTNHPLCSILLTNPEKNHLILGAAPGLPDEFTRRLIEKPIPIKDGMGTSALAARVGETVITEDIATDPQWDQIREFALKIGLRSCCSVPVFSSDRDLLGTVTLYHLTPRRPEEDELKWVNAAVKLVTLAVERSRTAEALREYQDRIRATFAAAGAGIAITAADGKYLMANPAYCAMLGYSEEELRQTDFPSVTHPEDRPGNLASIEELLAGRIDHFKIEKRCLHKNGSVVWVRASVALMRTADGRPPNIIAVTEDITQRKKTEEKLHQSEVLLDKAQDAIIVRDLEGVVSFWNKSAERLYGWTAEEATGQNVRWLIYQDVQAFDKANRVVLKEGEWSGEFRQVRKDGDPILTESRWSLVMDNDGQPGSILDINTDITERKRLEQQFLRAQRMEGIGTLAGGIAHDLNNILSPILMATELLRQSNLLQEDLGLLNTIETSAQRGADMVRQVLSFARGTPGDRIPIPPRHVINDVVRIISETFPKNIRVEVEMHPDVSPILGDPTQINQVLLNLCINARDAMPEGGTLRLAVGNEVLDEHFVHINRQGAAGPHVLIEVADTGVGISEETMPKIFDPFFTTKPQGKGTGLGLPTVMSILNGHGGFATLDSQEGKGSVFRLHFPVADAIDENDVAPPPTRLPRGSGETILVVDDETSVRTITRQTLETFGYRVHLASNGAEGLQTYRAHRDSIDLVLTDMMMPVMAGAATIEAIRKENPDIPIIAASGLSSREQEARAAAKGALLFLHKPYTASKLLDTLSEALNRKPGETSFTKGNPE